MKSILAIEIGRFGQHLYENLTRHDNQIMTTNISEGRLGPVSPYVVSARIGDCINEAVFKSLGIGNFGICFICIENNFRNGLEVTSLIKGIGAKYVVSKANRSIHARLLLKSGADEMAYLDRDVVERVAIRYSANNVFDYTELAGGISTYEIKSPPQRVGKSIKDSDIRRLYGISVAAVKNPDEHMRFMPGADHVTAGDNYPMVTGKQGDVEKIAKHLTKNV